MIATNASTTPEQLLTMPDSKGLELVAGRIVEKSMGYDESKLALRIGVILANYCWEHGLGELAGADGGFQCFPNDPHKVRKPDVSFVSQGRLPPDQEVGAYCRIPPDLAVEVISPNDLFEEVSAKVQEYLEAGVKRVWIVDPVARQLQVHHSSGGRILTINDELTDEEILPGFSCPLRRIFARGQ